MDMYFECQYAEVVEVTRETPNCIVVEFDCITVGFPPEHTLQVARP